MACAVETSYDLRGPAPPLEELEAQLRDLINLYDAVTATPAAHRPADVPKAPAARTRRPATADVAPRTAPAARIQRPAIAAVRAAPARSLARTAPVRAAPPRPKPSRPKSARRPPVSPTDARGRPTERPAFDTRTSVPPPRPGAQRKRDVVAAPPPLPSVPDEYRSSVEAARRNGGSLVERQAAAQRPAPAPAPAPARPKPRPRSAAPFGGAAPPNPSQMSNRQLPAKAKPPRPPAAATRARPPVARQQPKPAPKRFAVTAPKPWPVPAVPFARAWAAPDAPPADALVEVARLKAQLAVAEQRAAAADASAASFLEKRNVRRATEHAKERSALDAAQPPPAPATPPPSPGRAARALNPFPVLSPFLPRSGGKAVVACPGPSPPPPANAPDAAVADAAYLSAFGEAYRSPAKLVAVPLVEDENSPPSNPFANILASVLPVTPQPR